MEPLLKPKQVSELIHVTEQTLAKWRYLKKGPNYIKMGSLVRYRMEDVCAYVDKKVLQLKD